MSGKAILDTQDSRLLIGFMLSGVKVPILVRDDELIHFYRPHFFLPQSGSRVSASSGFLNLPSDANPLKPLLPDGFGFFHELLGGTNHSPIA